MAIERDELDSDMKVLDRKDLQIVLRIGKNKAYNLMHSDGFPSFKLGKTWLVRENALREWLKDTDYSEYRLD